MIQAVVFDMDGVLLDSEQVWDEIREELVVHQGGLWHDGAQQDMMGMSSPEWARYMHEQLGVADSPEEIVREVVRRMVARYRQHLPLMPEAPEAVDRLAATWPLGLASSSNRELIDLALTESRLARHFAVSVSSEEVAQGKPAPDVYLEAARQLGVDPGNAAAVEDSTSGIESAKAAGMRVIAIPNRHYPPVSAAIATADIIIDSLPDLTPAAVTGDS